MMRISRDAILIGGFAIRWYGILIALGALGAVIIAARRERRFSLPRDTSINLAIICIPAGIIFARLYYVAFSWDYYGGHIGEIFNLRGGGLAIYGGVIGGALAGLIYARAKRIAFLSLADLIAPGLAFAQAVGRWGNFINQEAYGAQVSCPGLQFFPMAVNISGTWHYATFFYESLWCMGIAATILLLERKGHLSRRGDGALFYVYLYAAERAMVEWLRDDSLYMGSIRVSQLLSLCALIACAAIGCARHKKIAPLAFAIGMAAMIALNFPLPAALCAVLCVTLGVYNNIKYNPEK